MFNTDELAKRLYEQEMSIMRLNNRVFDLEVRVKWAEARLSDKVKIVNSLLEKVPAGVSDPRD